MVNKESEFAARHAAQARIFSMGSEKCFLKSILIDLSMQCDRIKSRIESIDAQIMAEKEFLNRTKR